jgi:hypothetical protein
MQANYSVLFLFSRNQAITSIRTFRYDLIILVENIEHYSIIALPLFDTAAATLLGYYGLVNTTLTLPKSHPRGYPKGALIF